MLCLSGIRNPEDMFGVLFGVTPVLLFFLGIAHPPSQVTVSSLSGAEELSLKDLALLPHPPSQELLLGSSPVLSDTSLVDELHVETSLLETLLLDNFLLASRSAAATSMLGFVKTVRVGVSGVTSVFLVTLHCARPGLQLSTVDTCTVCLLLWFARVCELSYLGLELILWQFSLAGLNCEEMLTGLLCLFLLARGPVRWVAGWFRQRPCQPQ